MLSIDINIGVRVESPLLPQELKELADDYFEEFFPVARVASAYTSYCFTSPHAYVRFVVLDVVLHMVYAVSDFWEEADRLCDQVARDISRVEGAERPCRVIYRRFI